MLTLYIHISSFLLWFFMLFMSLFIFMFISSNHYSIYMSWDLYNLWNFPLSFSLLLDFYSILFSSVVLLISSVIMVYSYFYMSPYSKSIYFLILTNLFIFSMLVVITFSDLLFIMLGWDGLGVISFFLIVYYQNQSSITNGIFTILMNRIGDGFFLVSIVLFYFTMPDLSFVNYFSMNWLVSVLLFMLMITFMTKSALFPFSSWLPAAMSAPTPISALVHSSTLVTAGLFLMIRFSYLLYYSSMMMELLLFISVFTSFYAGVNTLFEQDFKKLIALSTLSHLGFISFAFSLGLLKLAFFHLLIHALFKSLLFMTMGDIIINLNHSQDLRYLSQGMKYTPFSSIFMFISIFNLLGLPFMSGFFSKDLILEYLSFSSSSYLLVILVYLNLFFTFYYSYQFFYYSYQSNKLNPYQMIHSPIYLHSFLLGILAFISILFGLIFMQNFYFEMNFLVVPSEMKFIPIFLCLIMLSYLILVKSFPTLKNTNIYNVGNSMLYLSILMNTSTSFMYLISLMKLSVSVESGSLNNILNICLPEKIYMLSLSFFKIVMFNSLNIMILSIFIFLFFICL